MGKHSIRKNGGGAGEMVRSSNCSSRECRFDSQHSSVIPIGGPIAFSGLCDHQKYMWYIDNMHAKQHTHKDNFFKKTQKNIKYDCMLK